MKMNKTNEGGYALVTVLLTMTIFMSLAFSFMGQSVNSQKQNKVIEEKSQSVALAEMGVTYFHKKVEDAYSTVKSNYYKYIDEDQKNNTKRDYLEVAKQELSDLVIVINKKPILPINPTDGSFEIQNPKVFPVEGKIKVEFYSIGTVEKEEVKAQKKLYAYFYFDLNETELGESGGNGNANNNLPTFDKIAKPSGNNVCLNPTNINNCNEILFNEPGVLGNQLNNSSKVTIYSTSTFEVKDANRIKNTDIHADGSISFKNMNNATNSIIETKGAASFDGQLRINTSELLVGGSLFINGHLELNSGSFVYINGDASITKHLKIQDSQSKVCVKGSLSIGNKLEDPYNRLLIYDENPTEFLKNCGSGPSNSSGLQWGNMNPDITVKY